jgi:hypothetical protein
MSNDTARPMSDDEVVALAKAAIEASRDDLNQRTVTDPLAAPRDLSQQPPGITIDLGHRNIVRLPDEVIDVIRAEIERLALSHNLLSTLPLRLTECTRLRYLNVRFNSLREFPEAILRMSSLEILDVSKNKLKVIPKEIVNLTSLKVFALQKNKIEELPVCFGDMSSLQVLKLDGNPISFPPPEVITLQDNMPSPANENERDKVIAVQVKKFMKQHASQDKKRADVERLRYDTSGDESWSESNLETPRPSRRANGGRFPVKPSISNLDGFSERKDSPGAAPPIPTRSHYRVQSQQNNVISRRPPVSPLVLSNGSERNRSQSEGAGAATIRAKRMGIYTNKSSDLGAVDELRRTSHFRGFSQGYVVPNGNMTNGMSGPATAVGYGDTGTARPLLNRPLSDVRENMRGSGAPDVVVDAAKTFLYAISQLSDTIFHMVRSIKRTDRTKEGLRRKEDFGRRYNATYLHIRALAEMLQRFDSLAEEDEEEAQKLSKAVYHYALKCLDLAMYLSLSIAENRAEIAHYADPRIVRSFLFLEQASSIEMRNACSILGAEFRDTTVNSRRRPSAAESITSRAPSRGPLRVRRFQTSPPQRNGQYQVPPPVMLHSNDTSRTNTLTSISAATPRSGESFALSTAMSRANTLTGSFDDVDEDALFERIYGKLRAACECCRDNIPQISRFLKSAFEILRRELDSEDLKIKVLHSLIEKCENVERLTYPLARRLSQMQLKDAYARNLPDFWEQCLRFLRAWGELAQACTTEGRNQGLLSPEVKQLMKPAHRTVKEASLAINDSPWAHFSNPTAGSRQASFTSRTQVPRFGKPTLAGGGGAPFPGPINTSISSLGPSYHPQSTSSVGSGSIGYFTPVPATPLSAALGPAAQATVPNTPNQNQFGSQGNAQFAGNVIERAERLLSQPSRRF